MIPSPSLEAFVVCLVKSSDPKSLIHLCPILPTRENYLYVNQEAL